MDSILLLGGSGYIGTHLMLELHGKASTEAGRRYRIVILDREVPNFEAVQLAQEKAGGLEVLYFNVDLEFDPLKNWPEFAITPYCGIMLAALKDVNEAERIPHEYLRMNISVCVNSMQYLSSLGVRRLIQASSSTLYHHIREEPFGVYGYSKQVSEQICKRVLQFGQQLLILRYMNPIGSHPEIKAFAKIGICQKLANLKPGETFVNRGNCIRDYIHITDLAAMHTLALKCWDTELFNPNSTHDWFTLNVGTGVRTTVAELLETFQRVTGKSVGKVIEASRQEHEGPDTTDADTTKLESEVYPMAVAHAMKSLEESLKDYC